MATFAAIVGSNVVFNKSFRSVAGGTFDTNSIDALFTPHGFITPYWSGGTVMSDYFNGRPVPKRSACNGEMGYLITHDEKAYVIDLWKEEHVQKNGSSISMMQVYHGGGCFNAIATPIVVQSAVRMAFHLCENDFDKSMKLLGRRHNICVEDYVCISISDIAKRLRDEGKTKEPCVLDPIRYTEVD